MESLPRTRLCQNFSSLHFEMSLPSSSLRVAIFNLNLQVETTWVMNLFHFHIFLVAYSRLLEISDALISNFFFSESVMRWHRLIRFCIRICITSSPKKIRNEVEDCSSELFLIFLLYIISVFSWFSGFFLSFGVYSCVHQQTRESYWITFFRVFCFCFGLRDDVIEFRWLFREESWKGDEIGLSCKFWTGLSFKLSEKLLLFFQNLLTNF